MDTAGLATIVALLVALSVASERLVEIIKGLIPSLNNENEDPRKEGLRKSGLQTMAIVAGIVTAFLARPAIEDVVPGPWNSLPNVFALGLLASGGSGFWNSVLTYVNNVKNIKRLEAEQKKTK